MRYSLTGKTTSSRSFSSWIAELVNHASVSENHQSRERGHNPSSASLSSPSARLFSQTLSPGHFSLSLEVTLEVPPKPGKSALGTRLNFHLRPHISFVQLSSRKTRDHSLSA